MDCKYSEVCKHRDGCIEDEKDPMECWAYLAIEGLVGLPFTKRMDMLDEEAIFPDEILYKDDAGMEWKLFLDRAFYSTNFKDEMYIRYVSVDMALMEEEPENA